MQTYLLSFTREADGSLVGGDVIGEGSVAHIEAREPGNGDDEVANQWINKKCEYAQWRKWSDNVDQECIDDWSGRWIEYKKRDHVSGGNGPWVDAQGDPIYYTLDADENVVPITEKPASNIELLDEDGERIINAKGSQFTYPQPLLADIAQLDDDQWVLSFRDRGSDQYMNATGENQSNDWRPSGATYGFDSNDNAVSGKYITTGDTIRADIGNDGTMTFPTENDFQDGSTSKGTGVHRQSSYAGMAYVPSGNYIVGNQLDANDYGQLGLRVWDATTGVISDRFPDTPEDPDPDNKRTAIDITNNFYKNAGLADIEVAVNEASQQIGNRLWIDDNRDGVQTAGEDTVLEGVTVFLYDTDGNKVAETRTNESGEYYFGTEDGVEPGVEYEIRIDPAAFEDGGKLQGYLPTTAKSTENGGNAENDSDGVFAERDGVDVVLATVTAPPYGRNDHSIDFGFVPVVSIGDYVWLDNGDGVQGEGDTPLDGIEVKLLDKDGNEVATTTTKDGGYYVFPNLPTNTEYFVEFPTTYVDEDGRTFPLVDPEQGDDESKDSNPVKSTGRTAAVTTPASGDNSTEPGKTDVPTIDAGYDSDAETLVSIGDYVWFDENEDGVQGEPGDEPAIPNVPVELYEADENGQPTGDPIATAETNENGYYVFPGLPTNHDYVVKFPDTVKLPADEAFGEYAGRTFHLTEPGTDATSNEDSNPATDTGLAPVTTPASGKNSTADGEADDNTIDAGYTPGDEELVSVGNKVWFDENGNGQQDEGEDPIPGVIVSLLDCDGNPVLDEDGNPVTAETDKDGYYVFPDLKPDTCYTIEFPNQVKHNGHLYRLTEPGQGDDEDRDSNPAKDNGRVKITTPKSGDNSSEPEDVDDPTIDAGFSGIDEVLVSIGNRVWIDENHDGKQSDGEKPVPGATVELFDGEGNPVRDENGDPRTAVTDKNGHYVFDGLTPDTDYQVKFPTTVTIDGVEYTLVKPGQGGADEDSNPGEDGFAKFRTPATGDNSADPEFVDDPTIDAGFEAVVVDPDPETPVTPEEPNTEEPNTEEPNTEDPETEKGPDTELGPDDSERNNGDKLSETSADAPIALGAGALVLVLGGAALLFARRRRADSMN